MTPKGLQAIREHGVGWCNEKQFADVLDLTETLAGALDVLITQLDVVGNSDEFRSVFLMAQLHHGAYHGPMYVSELAAARAALDKYREFK